MRYIFRDLDQKLLRYIPSLLLNIYELELAQDLTLVYQFFNMFQHSSSHNS